MARTALASSTKQHKDPLANMLGGLAFGLIVVLCMEATGARLTRSFEWVGLCVQGGGTRA